MKILKVLTVFFFINGLAACSIDDKKTNQIAQDDSDKTENGTVVKSADDFTAETIESKSGSEVVSCSFSINGENYEGNSKSECDKLKSELEIDLGSPDLDKGNLGSTVYACSFNIDGVQYEGDSKEKCDKLKTDLGINDKFPSTPSSNPTSTTVSNSSVACSYNINGVLYEGASEKECAQLKVQLGL